MGVALLSDTKTISSCWTWYAIDNHFPFFSPHYQSHRVIRNWSNIKLLDVVWYWFFSVFFNLTKQWQSPCYQTLKEYRVAGLGMLLIFIFLFCHPLSESPCYQKLKQYQIAGLGMILTFFCFFNLTKQWQSPYYQTLKQYQVAGLGILLIIIFLLFHPTIRVTVLSEFETISSCWTWYGTDFFLHF